VEIKLSRIGEMIMAKHNVRQTKGVFKLVGNVKGTMGERFFKESTFDSKNGEKTKNELNFGLQTSDSNETYVKIQGYDGGDADGNARFSRWDNKEKKSYKEFVSWEDRFDFDKAGFEPFFGIKLKLEPKGDTVSLFQFDACEDLRSLNDGDGIYAEGNIKVHSYMKNGTEKIVMKDFEPTKIYAQDAPVDFSAENFKEINKFEQEIIMIDVSKGEDGRFVLQAYLVTYSGVEMIEFIIENESLAKKLKKNVKPFIMIKVMGRLSNKLEEVEEAWGDDEDLDGGYVPKVREMVITKAYPETIDKETYTEEIINSLIKVDDDFGAELPDDNNEDEDGDDVWA